MRRIALFLCLGTLAGCAATDAAGDWAVTVDTLPNGAVRVVNTPPDDGGAPTWALEEELRIGSIEGGGPTSFGQLKGLVVLEDGRMAVLDAQAQEVRVFGPEGGHQATFGGRGAGPGELEAGFGLMRGPDDMLWVPDHRNARMSVYHPVRGLDRSYPLRVLSRGFIWSGVMTPDGRILKPSITMPDRSPVVRVYDPEMNLVDSLPMPPRPEFDRDDPPNAFTWGSREAGAWGFYGVPFFPQTQQVLDPGEAIWATEFGDPSYRIARRDLRGDTTLVLETRRAPVAITAAERDSVIDVVREALRERGAANQDWSKIPEVKPAVAGIFVAEDGGLWVRTPSPDGRITYDVYEPNGHYAGTAATDLPIYPYLPPVIRGDRVWAVVTDELDVQYVVRARLRTAADPTLALAVSAGPGAE